MVRLPPAGELSQDPTAVNLVRLISRLKSTLLEPDGETAHRLRTSRFERNKVAANLEYTKNLLLRLQQDAASIKNPTKKQEVQDDLREKQDQLILLDGRLYDLNVSDQDHDDDRSSEGEDLLGSDTPSESLDDHPTPAAGSTTDDDDFAYQQILSEQRAAAAAAATPAPAPRDELFPSSLRSRHTAAASGISTTAPAPLTDALMAHHRSEQEELTGSLLSMAQALKSSSQSFSSSLESEKGTLGRAGEGLERNASGLEAASRRMGYLRQMSEGRGWWGRVMLYAWIFGLMFVAFFIVAFMPKLRF